jgi:hypothetical protein
MTASRWVNLEDEGALTALLRRLPQRLPTATIDAIWIFPTRRTGDAESTVVVLATFDEQPDRRRVTTVHFLVNRDAKGRATVAETLDEHASAPLDAVQRIVDGVLRRLDEESAQPRFHRIDGRAAQWDALIRDIHDSTDRPVHTRSPDRPRPATAEGQP